MCISNYFSLHVATLVHYTYRKLVSEIIGRQKQKVYSFLERVAEQRRNNPN